MLDHPGQEDGAEIDDRFDVGADHRHLALAIAVVDGARGGETRVVDEHFDGESPFGQGAGQPTPGISVGEVERDHLGPHPVGLVELGGELGEARFATGDQRDAVAALGQFPGQIGADARRSAGDKSGGRG